MWIYSTNATDTLFIVITAISLTTYSVKLAKYDGDKLECEIWLGDHDANATQALQVLFPNLQLLTKLQTQDDIIPYIKQTSEVKIIYNSSNGDGQTSIKVKPADTIGEIADRLCKQFAMTDLLLTTDAITLYAMATDGQYHELQETSTLTNSHPFVDTTLKYNAVPTTLYARINYKKTHSWVPSK